jgi:hypothetical protein
MANDFETKKLAASLAQVLTDRVLDTPSLSVAFREAVSPEQKSEYNRLTRVVLQSSLQTAAAGSRKDKEKSASVLFNAMIIRAEMIVDVMREAKPKSEEAFSQFFASVKKAPKYADYDFAKAYEDAGAPLLAKAYKNAPGQSGG